MVKVIVVAVVVHLSIEDVTRVCHGAAGCAQVQGDKCLIHVLQPQIGYRQEFEVIGHEFWHCVHGKFH